MEPHKTPPTLRDQIVDAMDEWAEKNPSRHGGGVLWDEVFDDAVMPLLQKAMDAGELLVSRNTGPRIPVPEAARTWIKGMLVLAEQVHRDQSTISKRTLLNIIFKLGKSAEQAMTDIEKEKL